MEEKLEQKEELKTLKEIIAEIRYSNYPEKKAVGYDFYKIEEKIKQEAIKDIKHLRKNRSSNPKYSKEELNGIEKYIMWKNILTEGDLK